MKPSLLLILVSVCAFSRAQTVNYKLNASFEAGPANGVLREWNWYNSPGYEGGIDSTVSYSGKNAFYIKSTTSPNPAQYGAMGINIPARKGQQLTMEGYLKLEGVQNGLAGFYLAIIGKNGTIQKTDLSENGVSGTQPWKKYKVSIPLSADARTINVATVMAGQGKLWIDDITLSIDGKPFEQADTVSAPLAESDTSFSNGSSINEIAPSAATNAALVLLGQVWGFVKYHHPAVAAGNFNMDAELFRFMPIYLATAQPADQQRLLYNWVKKFGAVKTKKDTAISQKPFFETDISWLTERSLGKELHQLLSDIYHAERKNQHYYIAMAQGVGNPVIKNELPYAKMQFSDAGLRMLALYRYWNLIQYFFPYRNLLDENWNTTLERFVPRFAYATSEKEYKLALLQLIGSIHDTHANVWSNEPVLAEFFGKRYGPLSVVFVEDKPVVTGYLNDSLGKKTGILPGDVIEKINGIPAKELVQNRIPYFPASNLPTKMRDIGRDFLRSNDSTLSVTFNRDGKSFEKMIPTYTPMQVNVYKRYSAADTCFGMAAPGIAWIYPGKIKNTYLPAIKNELKNTKGLIIDLRCYPSDFTVFTLGGFLVPKSTPFVKFSFGGLLMPGAFYQGQQLNVAPTDSHTYKGKVVILINELTQSQAEYTTMAFRTAPGALVVGSTTAGADGNVSGFLLPGNVSTMFSGIGVYYPDGRETQRVGIIPDVECKPTIAGIKAGRDELMEKAIELLNKER